MLTVLTLLVTCVAVDGLCFPSHCRRVSWVECGLEHTRPSQHTSTVSGQPCILCNNPDKESVITTSHIPIPTPICIHVEISGSILGIRGYPLGTFSTTKLSIPHPSSLESLALVQDGITDIERKALMGFTGLLRLNLAMNELTHVKRGWFAGLGNLQHLILSHNRIVHIDLCAFNNLTLSRLELQNNLLKTVCPNWFYGLNRYRPVNTLSLASNPIASIPRRAFRYIPDIRSLDLGSTALSCLDKDIFGELQSLKSLNISGTLLVLQTWCNQPPCKMSWSFFTRVSFFGKQDIHVHVSLDGLHFLSCVEYDPNSNRTKLLSLFGPTAIAWEKVSASNFGSCPKLGAPQNEGTAKPPFIVIVTNRSSHDELFTNELNMLCSQAWDHSGGLTLALESAERLSLQLIPMDAYLNTSPPTIAMVLDHPPENSTNYLNISHSKVRTVSCFLITKNRTSQLSVEVSQFRRQHDHSCFDAQTAEDPTFSALSTETNHLMTTTASAIRVPTTNQGDKETSTPDHVTVITVTVGVSVVGVFLLSLMVLVGYLLWRYVKYRNNGSNEQESQLERAARDPALSINNRQEIVEENGHHSHQEEDDPTSISQNQQEHRIPLENYCVSGNNTNTCSHQVIPIENNIASNNVHNQQELPRENNQDTCTNAQNEYEAQENDDHATKTHTDEEIQEVRDHVVSTHNGQKISEENDRVNDHVAATQSRQKISEENVRASDMAPHGPLEYQATSEAHMAVSHTT